MPTGWRGADADADGLAARTPMRSPTPTAATRTALRALGSRTAWRVRRPPLPNSRAFRKITTNTATVAITKTFE